MMGAAAVEMPQRSDCVVEWCRSTAEDSDEVAPLDELLLERDEPLTKKERGW